MPRLLNSEVEAPRVMTPKRRPSMPQPERITRSVEPQRFMADPVEPEEPIAEVGGQDQRGPASTPVSGDRSELENPHQRFQVLGIATSDAGVKATILDHKSGKRYLRAVGDQIADHVVLEIDAQQRLVQMRGPGGERLRCEWTLNLRSY